MTTFSTILDTLGAGLPVLLAHLAMTFLLLIAGVAVYMGITPFDERRLIAEGNLAGGVTLGGAVAALSIPLAATLATSGTVVDILLWGAIALIVQLLAFVAATLLMRGLRAHIEAGNVAAAVTLIGIQFAVALLNAAAMAG